MFKGYLIEDPGYYKLKRQGMIISLISSMAMGSISGSIFGAAHATTLIFISIFLIILIVFFFQFKRRKQSHHLIRNRKIEIGFEKIQLRSSSGIIEEEFYVSALDSIWVQNMYKMPEENLREVLNELSGKHQTNYIVVAQNGNQHKFEFTIDSYYSIEQLKKIINHWKEQEYKVETIPT